MSSSPAFPSPSALMQKGPQLKLGSRAAPIPKFAAVSFINATNLPSDQQPAGTAIATEDPFDDEAAEQKASREPIISKEVDRPTEPAVKKTRKPRAKKLKVGAEEAVPPAGKPPRKPRAKRDVGEGQLKIPKGRVTKASAVLRADKAAGKKMTGAVSGHFAHGTGDAADPSELGKSSENDLLLQEAVKRRKNWTPPRKIAGPLCMEMTPAENGEAPALSIASGNKQKTITELFGNFGYIGGEDRAASKRITDQSGTRKRRLIELVKTNVPAVEPPVAKVKSVKKKHTTITAQAISAYAVDGREDLNLLPAPLLQYFSYKDSTEENGLGTTDGFKFPPKPRSKSPVKTPSKSSKSKKGTAEAPILLSPGTALKRVEKQEFVFGTSSQLAREDSPALLRDIQQAMHVSNQVEEDHFEEFRSLSPSKSTSVVERGTELYAAKRNLWAAASRDAEGGTADIETLDLSESPQVLASAKPSAPVSGRSEVAAGPTMKSADDEWYDLDDDPLQLKEKSVTLDQPSSRIRPEEAAIRPGLLSSPPRGVKAARPSSSKMKPFASKPPPKVDLPSKQTSTAQKPDYGSYPTTQLAKEIASYKFKPVKGREQMIALLERCWEGKQKATAGSQLTSGLTTCSPVKSNSDSSKPLVLRQTPKRQQKKDSRIPEEISDSDTPLTPSPPRRGRTKACTPPLQLSVSTDPDESLVLSPTSQQLRLHKHITQAITSAPRSTDSKNPNWHEKILLYDPIVLEDLATWLNTGALQRVGWDGEVSAYEVKRWCLEKSICCLWRKNLRGVARSRF